MRYKILIVDDEPAIRRLLERIFHRDYEVFTAASGIDALEIVEKNDIALVISDQRMPELTGIEFLKRVRVSKPRVVGILLTGYTDSATLNEAMNSGAVHTYVTKPWENVELRRIVADGLANYESRKHAVVFDPVTTAAPDFPFEKVV